jgi:glycosyltransferase involved in cell wall biosynthesis
MVRGGAERVVSRLSQMLNDSYDISIVVFNDSKASYEVGCEIIPLKSKDFLKTNNKFTKALNFIIFPYLYNKFKRRNNIDITYSFGDTANFVNVFSGGNDNKVISIRGFKRVRTGKSLKERLILRPLSRLICKKSDSIVSVSKLMSKTISEVYKIPLSKIKTSYNGYDIENIIKHSKEEISEEISEKIGENKVIVTAGTFRDEKGYWHLLKAFSIVSNITKDVKLLILGEDYSGNIQKVKKLARELNISKNVIYGGYQSNPFKYFVKSSIYVLSSTSEGFPNAMVEAMACKLPIIASDCKTGPREILAPNTNIYSSTKSIEFSEFGVLVKQMNSIENYDIDFIEDCDKYLADAILELLQNDELRLEYGSRSLKRVYDFDYSEWLKQQREIVEF